MILSIDQVRYHRIALKATPEYFSSVAWGGFIRYVEFGDDGFPLRQVDEYENGYLARYDRSHWRDQFGSLGDFRFGKLWVKNWGLPDVIAREDFETKWRLAEQSPPIALRESPPSSVPPWIELYLSGKWKGQE